MKANRKYWFVSKKFGWGWTPATKEGWVVLAVYLIFIFFHAYIYSINPQNIIYNIVYFVDIFTATITLILICFLTGEKPRWRWGK